jgi:hypothetical protein
MGAPRIGDKVFEYMKTHPNVPVSATELANALDFTQGQVRAVMRRFSTIAPTSDYFTIVIPSNSWLYSERPKASSAGEVKSLPATVDAGARAARESARAAGPTVYEYVGEFTDGTLLLRSDASRMYRAELTEL